MVEKILVYEHNAFLFLNGSDSPFFDHFIWLYSGKMVWLPLAVFILYVLCSEKNWKKSLLVLVGIALVITLCDQFSSGICKPIFTRFRPTHHTDFMDQVKVMFDYRGGRYGFISSHAANAFGFATFMALLFKNKLFSCTIFIWAAVMAYSRVYLGVHFISDIVPGAISGLVFGYIVYKLHTFTYTKFVAKGEGSSTLSLYPVAKIKLIVGGIFLTIFLMIIFNNLLVKYLH